MDKKEILLLTDEELFAKLQEVGLVSGPIADSTRSLYQAILFKRLNGEEVFGEDSPGKIALEESLINGEEASLLSNERSRRSVSKTPSVYMEATPPPEPVRRSTRKSVAAEMPPSQEVPKDEEDVVETTRSNIQRRHTFKRWNPDEEEDMAIQEESSYFRQVESRQYYNGQHDVFAETSSVQKSSSGTWMFVAVGLLIIAALAALYFVGNDVDPFQQIEDDAQKLASKLGVD